MPPSDVSEMLIFELMGTRIALFQKVQSLRGTFTAGGIHMLIRAMKIKIKDQTPAM